MLKEKLDGMWTYYSEKNSNLDNEIAKQEAKYAHRKELMSKMVKDFL